MESTSSEMRWSLYFGADVAAPATATLLPGLRGEVEEEEGSATGAVAEDDSWMRLERYS